MKLVLAFLLSINIAHAGTKAITCTFKSFHPTATLTIAVDNIENPLEISDSPIYFDYDGNETSSTFSGEDEIEWLFYVISGWDSYFTSDADGNIAYQLDSDGCDVGVLKLYRNNGFKYGYVKVEHRCSDKDAPDSYSKASCTVTDVK